MSRATFRVLLVASLLLGVLGAVLDALIPSLISTSLSDALDNEPLPSVLTEHYGGALIVLAPYAIAAIVGPIGMFFFRRWGRSLSAWCTLAGLAIYPLLGASGSSGWSSALMEASLVLWGVVLASAYGLSARLQFDASK